MKYAIIENESLARIELENSIAALRPEWSYAGNAESIEESIGLIEDNEDLDLIFMDIELDDGQCFEIFDQCDLQAAIIFTTAYSDYALRAFHLNSLDYLLKPFTRDNLEGAIKKFEKFSLTREKEEGTRQTASLVNDISKPSVQTGRILIQKGEDYYFERLEDIAWFFSDNKYTMCMTSNGEEHFTNFKSLNELEGQLPANDFFRLRRNVIASVSHIRKVSKFYKGALLVTLQSKGKEETIIVNQKNKADFLAWLGMH